MYSLHFFATNVNDLERLEGLNDLEIQKRGFNIFWRFQAATHIVQIAPKLLEIDQTNVDFNWPSLDFLGSKSLHAVQKRQNLGIGPTL